MTPMKMFREEDGEHEHGEIAEPKLVHRHTGHVFGQRGSDQGAKTAVEDLPSTCLDSVHSAPEPN